MSKPFRQLTRWLLPVLLIAQLGGPLALPAPALAWQTSGNRQVEELLRSLSVERKVGQLFTVSFRGTDVSDETDIADLIINDHIGGVQISAGRGNFSNTAQIAADIAQLTNNLQQLAARSAISPTQSLTTTDGSANPAALPTQSFIPLFVTVAQDEANAPHNESSRGLTPIPTELALGATWKPEYADMVGQVVGNELAQIGVNVLIGPVLDVADSPKLEASGDSGTRVFGGDPFWVSKFGAAYVAGVRRGSRNNVAVVPRNFPGLGSSDRSVQEEIPTVQKSLEQLKQIDLVPFFSVTQIDPANESMADGLLVSHIRYRGFQGNIRASTRPVSFDATAYQALMTLPQIGPWRANGGVTFSDVLGSPSVRRFYDPTEATFNGRQIAQDALVAGNDVLLLGDFGATNDWKDQLQTIKDTIAFFQSKYRDDRAFAERVDDALRRILNLKLRLYGGRFNLQEAEVDVDAAALMKPNPQALAAIAKDSLTLLSPDIRDLRSVLPSAPAKGESITFITDDRLIQDCANCPAFPAIPADALKQITLDLYGPNTTGQVNPEQVKALTFSDLAQAISAPISSSDALSGTALPEPSGTPTALASPTPTLAALESNLTQTPRGTNELIGPLAPTPTPTLTLTPTQSDVQSAINQAQWIVIAMLDMDPNVASTRTLREFLVKRADALRDKRVVVFAFSAPNYLDTTEISKVTAYFGAYSRSPAFLQAAVRALFGEVALGASPVSVPSLDYSLGKRVEPDPDQEISLVTDEPITNTEGTAVLVDKKIGDKLKLRAGPVVDRNGRPVPDGTQVQFVLRYPVERVEQRQDPVNTRDGIAETSIVIDRKGKVEVRAIAEPALRSLIIKLNISDNEQVSIETIKPTAAPTPTPEPTFAPTSIPTPAPTAAPIATPTVIMGAHVNMAAFIYTFLGMLVAHIVALQVLASTLSHASAIQRWRTILSSWIAGWLAYVGYSVLSPQLGQVSATLGSAGFPLAALGMTVIVLIIAILTLVKPEHAGPPPPTG